MRSGTGYIFKLANTYSVGYEVQTSHSSLGDVLAVVGKELGDRSGLLGEVEGFCGGYLARHWKQLGGLFGSRLRGGDAGPVYGASPLYIFTVSASFRVGRCEQLMFTDAFGCVANLLLRPMLLKEAFTVDGRRRLRNVLSKFKLLATISVPNLRCPLQTSSPIRLHF